MAGTFGVPSTGEIRAAIEDRERYPDSGWPRRNLAESLHSLVADYAQAFVPPDDAVPAPSGSLWAGTEEAEAQRRREAFEAAVDHAAERAREVIYDELTATASRLVDGERVAHGYRGTHSGVDFGGRS